MDGFFIGPGDLSLRLNCANDWSDPQMAAAQTRVAAAAAKHGLAWGRPTRDGADIRAVFAAGGRLIAHGSDFGAVYAMTAQFGKTLAEALGPPG